MSEPETESFRAACEARFWLKYTKRNPDAINLVLDKIKKKRGEAAAQKLRENMRKAWKATT